jgi:hypothetical protein
MQPLLWNSLLTAISAVNLAIAASIFALSPTTLSNVPSVSPHRSFWTGTHRNLRPLLALAFTVACAIRSAWPRVDGDRICFWDHLLSTVAVGRSVATFGELSFAALVSMAVANSAPTSLPVQRLASGLFSAIAFAQCCCWYGVTTRNQLGHVIEESIWMASALSVALVAFNIQRIR